ncbi:MAG TPA: ribonuclease HII [Patescibacteria group bacterium]
MKTTAGWEYELKHQQAGKRVIAGLDEVGRGCWAGPLVACAYVFHNVPCDIVVGDSKTFSEKQRKELAFKLVELGVSSLGEVSAEEIDALGLQQAQYLAYERALQGLPIAPEVVLLDGRPWKTELFFCDAVVDGDAKIASIAAASIVAKVYRDTYMREVAHSEYPYYGFNQHVGYGTKVHQSALQDRGTCILHRQSFKPIKSIVSR